MDPRTPVLVGAGQVTHRPGDDGSPSPLELMVRAARAAEEDAGVPGLLVKAGSVAVVDLFSWLVPDPAALLASELGIAPRESVRAVRGGTGPIALLGDLCAKIAAGDLDVALLAGGEVVTTFMKAASRGEDPGWPTQPEGTAPTREVGEDRAPNHPAEEAAGLLAPIFFYPLFEQAVRGAEGRGVDEHQAWLGELWARFAAVARDNPHAWTRDAPTDPAAISRPGPGNRLVSAPYTKLLNANIQVDQGAALVLCSAQAAQDAGVPRERWVFVHGTAGAHDHWHVAQRHELHRSPAIAACAAALREHTGTDPAQADLLDLYSCFPSAVQIGAGELGIDLGTDERAPTVTGGLTFAGGPANDYCTHAIASLATRLREAGDGATGLATGVGWYLTKHALATFGTAPPPTPFADLHPQDVVDVQPSREVVQGEAARGPVETYTALYDRDGTPTLGIVATVLEDGRRALGRSEDGATVADLVGGDPLGREVSVSADGRFTLA
ncbi:hypothetical protein [Conexibacter sp. SYSU D00693]|uniref:hypothetical protein n=1 Tax=Conexibacter sp. SYSU D00693 TaxID=2812560 RepID=UPI00196B6F1A|nr:hypothetical protein [Conexibacter sp. SYSU D00693]